MNKEISGLYESVNTSIETPIEIVKKFFPGVMLPEEKMVVEKKIKNLLQKEYFYSSSATNEFLQHIHYMDAECLNALLESTNEKHKNIKVKRWSLKKLKKLGKKIPECYLILSYLKKDYKHVSKQLKENSI